MSIEKSNFFWSRRELFTSAGLLTLTFSLNSPLSKRQRAIILGNILGDGHLQIAPNEKSARLRFTHSMEQEQYVHWQYRNLDWLSKKVKPPYETTTKKGYSECIGYTSYQPELLQFHQFFYKPTGLSKPKYRKIVPENLSDYLKDPISLMVWYLDDGTLRTDSGACRIATQSFTEEENWILQDCLQKNFNVKSVIEKWPDNQYNLSIPTRGGHSENFRNLFADTVRKEIPSMKYKVDRLPSI
jgi:hypothetical protein